MTVVRIEAGMSSAEVDFTAFYRVELGPQVRRAYLLVGDNETANDIVHDAMTAVYRHRSHIDEPGAYLNRAVLNGCRDVGRRRSSTDRLLRKVSATALTDTIEPADESLADVLATRPFNHRCALVLRFYAGFTTEEIATSLTVGPGPSGLYVDVRIAVRDATNLESTPDSPVVSPAPGTIAAQYDENGTFVLVRVAATDRAMTDEELARLAPLLPISARELANALNGSIPPASAPSNTDVPNIAPAAASGPAAAPSRPTYTVLVGDTLRDIAYKLGVPLQALLDANGMDNRSFILVGST